MRGPVHGFSVLVLLCRGLTQGARSRTECAHASLRRVKSKTERQKGVSCEAFAWRPVRWLIGRRDMKHSMLATHSLHSFHVRLAAFTTVRISAICHARVLRMDRAYGFPRLEAPL